MKKGFTLIELLVVVLIIGILSSIALPQYTLAVEKSRAAEAMVRASAIQRAVDMYLLENGYPSSEVEFGAEPSLFGMDGLNCGENDVCSSKDFTYVGHCNNENGCVFSVNRGEADSSYVLHFFRWSGTNHLWAKECEPFNDFGVKICNTLGLQ